MQIRVICVSVIVLCSSAFAGAQSMQTPAKIATFESDALSDPRAGVKRLVAAFEQIEREFKPRRDELQALRTKYDSILKNINETQAGSDPKVLAAKADEADTIKRDIERKQQDGQKALERRTKELTDPIFQDIGTALQAFAKQRGIDVVFDLSKMAGVVMVVNSSIDITDAFIADYNASHPVVPAGVPVKIP